MNFKQWQSKGKTTEIYGHSIFYVEHVSEKPTICFLHGYPSCSFDYYKIIDFLKNDFSYLIHDHLGFGLSSKPLNYSYSLIEQAEIAIELWRSLGLKEIHLVSHDYGTSIANEIIVRKLSGFEPVKIKTITFCNGSMHIELAKLKLVQKLLKHPFFGRYVAAVLNKPMFTKSMKDIWYNKTRFDIDEVSILFDMLMQNSSTDVLHKISQYNNERVKFWHRWIGNLPNIDIPTHILWAQQDPIAVKAIAEQLHKEIPDSRYTKIEECGHYPMLEKPDEWTTHLLNFIRIHI